MIIDIHTHTFPDRIAPSVIDRLSHEAHIRAFTDGTVRELERSASDAGIDLSVVLSVATAPGQVEKINTAAAAQNEKARLEGGHVLSFGCIHPDYENWHEELERVSRLGLKGIKIHPVYQGVDLDDLRYLRILDRAACLGLIVVTHAGLDVGFPGVVHCSPAMCRHVMDEIGSFPFIAAHMGGWRNWDEALEYLAPTDILLDTSFALGMMQPLEDGYWNEEDCRMLQADRFREMADCFGSDRILFGTDSPWSHQAQTLLLVRSFLKGNANAEEKILGGNARALLGIE